MLGFLAGLPGQIATVLSRLTSTRAGLLDNLDAAVSTRAAASTALSTATWTGTLAADLAARKQRVPTSVVGGNASQIVLPNHAAQNPIVGATQTSSGATTAATLKTILSVTGAGCLNFVSAQSRDATSRTIRVKVTIDGVAVADMISSAITATNTGIIAIGGLASYFDGVNYIPSVVPGKLAFNTSLLVQVASSLGETDKIMFNLAHEVH